MAKLIEEKYRVVSTGELRVGAYHVVIRKDIVDSTNLAKEEKLHIYAEDGKIIIAKKEEE